MSIQKEKDLYLAELLEREVIKKYDFDDIVFKPEINAFHSSYLSARFIDNINFGWSAWQAAKSQAVPEWKDYSQQSPRIDGRYQIFINGEQLAADWKSPFGFVDPIEGVALIQELITHWAVLSADPVIEAQEQSHD